MRVILSTTCGSAVGKLDRLMSGGEDLVVFHSEVNILGGHTIRWIYAELREKALILSVDEASVVREVRGGDAA